jgi:hypothetical protein
VVLAAGRPTFRKARKVGHPRFFSATVKGNPRETYSPEIGATRRTLRNYWSWSAYGKEGQKALRKLLPLLLAKREVAIAACSFDYSGSRLSDDERKRRVEFANRPIYTCDHWESGETRGKPGDRRDVPQVLIPKNLHRPSRLSHSERAPV